MRKERKTKLSAVKVQTYSGLPFINYFQIQEITLDIFLNPKIHPQVRMLAAVVLFETKPSLPVLTTLATAMLKEPSMQVASFIYSYLRVLGRSTAPDLQVM